jgi:hypothetical protein
MAAPRKCANSDCGATLTRSNARTCSPACRQKVHRASVSWPVELSELEEQACSQIDHASIHPEDAILFLIRRWPISEQVAA